MPNPNQAGDGFIHPGAYYDHFLVPCNFHNQDLVTLAYPGAYYLLSLPWIGPKGFCWVFLPLYKVFVDNLFIFLCYKRALLLYGCVSMPVSMACFQAFLVRYSVDVIVALLFVWMYLYGGVYSCFHTCLVRYSVDVIKGSHVRMDV